MEINYVAPIPQALTQAFVGAAATPVAKLAIALLMIRILGAASFLFTGATRLPLTAGWDHLVPAWFTRQHPRYLTPTNSIVVTAGAVTLLLLLGSAGVRAAETFGLLNDASVVFYALAYLAMFLIPICGLRTLRSRLPRWVAIVCALGAGAILFVIVISAYPFMDVRSPGLFAAKIVGTVLVVNAGGYAFYRLRRPA